jgi:1-acyl-sn-glycerol-3-phosphate acyltransferase
VPDEGPVIFASNHIGWLDGPLLILCTPRPAHALVKAEAFVGRTGRLLRFAGQIPLDRSRHDVGALRTAADALAAGQSVVVYPEGVRGAGDVAHTKDGVAWLALVSGAPVVPVAIFGTRAAGADAESRPERGATVDVVYGEPLRIEPVPWPRTRAHVSAVGRRITEHLRHHVEWAAATGHLELPGPLPRGSTDA